MNYSGALNMEQIGSWYRVTIAEHLMPEEFGKMQRWCEEYESDGSYSVGRTRFWFSQSEDATIFALRWMGNNGI